MLYTRSELYVRKDEYLRMLGAGNLAEALKSVPKEFTTGIAKSLGERQAPLTDILESIESFHVKLVRELAENFYVRDYARCVNGILSAYGTVIALLGYEKGLKPVSYVPFVSALAVEEYIGGRKPAIPRDPYSELLLSAFVEHKEIRAEDILRAYDHARADLVEKSNHKERLVAGLIYDLTLLRLCTIGELSRAPWRPLLLDQRDFISICCTFGTSIPSALDALKKTRPLMFTVSLIALDAHKVVSGDELLDLLITVAPAYFSTLVLRAERTSIFLKDFTATLRQLSLLKMVLTLVHLGDDALKSALKAFIERWVSP